MTKQGRTKLSQVADTRRAAKSKLDTSAPAHRTSKVKSSDCVPAWEGSVERWTINYARANEWRTCPLYDADDIIAEAYIKYMRCVERYQHVTSVRHFMSLYMITIHNHIVNLANERTRKPSGMSIDAVIDDTSFAEMLESKSDPHDSEDHFWRRVQHADPDVRQVIVRILGDPRVLRCEDGLRETTSERLKRLRSHALRLGQFRRNYESASPRARVARLVGAADPGDLLNRLRAFIENNPS